MTDKHRDVLIAVAEGAESIRAIAHRLGFKDGRSVGCRLVHSLIEKGLLRRLKKGELRITAAGKRATIA